MRSIRTILSILLISSPYLFASAQTPAERVPGRGRISGQVTLGGRVLSRVKVYLSRALPSEPERLQIIARTVTDADGRYLFAELPAGIYTILPQAPALAARRSGRGAVPGRVVNLDEGEAVDEVEIALVAGGVITGKVTDSEGRTMIGQRMSLTSYEAQTGTFYHAPADHEMYETDDRGIYRIYGLPPGRYLLSVDAGAGSANPAGYKRYADETYYREAPNESEATFIDVAEGSEVTGVDIRLRPRGRRYTIAGRVIDAETGAPVAGQAIAYQQYYAGYKVLNSPPGGERSDADGRFCLDGVPPGQYVVYVAPGAGGDYYSSPVNIELGNADLTGVEIEVRRSGSLSGQIVMSPGANYDLRSLTSDVRLLVLGQSERSWGTGSVEARIEPDGSFFASGLEPGYALFLLRQRNQSPIGLVIDRIEHHGIVQPYGIGIVAGQQVTGVRLFLLHGTGVVRGRISLIGGEWPPGLSFSLSLMRLNAAGVTSTPIQQADARGRFAIEGLISGEYLLGIYPSSFSNPAGGQGRRMRPVNKALQVNDGQTTEVEVTFDLSALGRP